MSTATLEQETVVDRNITAPDDNAPPQELVDKINEIKGRQQAEYEAQLAPPADEPTKPLSDAPAPPPVVEAQPAPKADVVPAIDPGLLQRGQYYGVEPGHYSTPQDFERAVGLAAHIAATTLRRQDQKPEPVQQPAAPEEELTLEPLDPNEFDPKLVKIHRVAQLLLEERKANKELLSRLQGNDQQRAQQQLVQALDAAFDGLGDDALGKGSIDSLRGTPAADNRLKLAKQVHILHAGYTAIGEKAPPFSELAKMAHLALFGNNIKQQAQQETAKQIADRARAANGQFLARPTHQATDTQLKGDEKALAAVGEFMQSRGLRNDE